MPNPYFKFKQFTVYHDRCAMKVTTDACLFGAWCAAEIKGATSSVQGAKKESAKLLDIGTGTGLLSLMITQKNSVSIDAVEIDEQAVSQALQNVDDSLFAKNITVYNADIAHWEKDNYDVIISNPPFYDNEIPSSQPLRNIAHHSEGLRLETLFPILYNKLTDRGSFYLLLPYKRKATIDILLRQHLLYVEKEVIVLPSASHLPFRLMIKGSKHPTAAVQSEFLSIYTTEKNYTPAFTALLKEYYLYL